MSVYPFDIDDDSTIGRVDDNITEIGGDVINSLRDAMFAVQKELGVLPSGSVSSISARLDKSLTSDGDIKASALASVGLVTLPVDNAQVGANAGIKESKLALDYSTSELHTLLQANTTLLNSINAYAIETGSNLGTHISGGALLIDGSPGRHVASHIDLNSVTTDARDATFSWTGLLDKDGNARSASNVASALLEINNDFTDHQNATSGAHVASAVDVDVDNYTTIPTDIDDLQKFVEYVDNVEILELGKHRATQHKDSVLLTARSQGIDAPDGYGRQNVIPPTPCQTYLVRSPNTTPVDDISIGDDVIKFVPDNTGFFFDSQFEKVQRGDVLRVNYGTGFESIFYVESVKFVPGSTWIVRINGTNFADSDGYAIARIDRPMADKNTAGVLAVASANATPVGSFDTILSSAIVGNPRGATALGLDFNPGQLDATHYNLYMEFYPNGNPSEKAISLPAVDVTGNAGTTPGKYTLQSVVAATNNKLREIGFNLRLIAFAHDGEFGIMIADAINNASFSIIKGDVSAGALTTGSFTNNVIGDDRGDGFDALGLGSSKADLSGIPYTTTFLDANSAAQFNTLVIPPVKKRNYFANGRKLDSFNKMWAANDDGYWDGYISARVPVGVFTVETTYSIDLDLKAAGLKPGMTIVVQPTLSFSDGSYFDVDYGRFIIKNVNFIPACPGVPERTLITVINGIHASGAGFGFSSGVGLAVRIYFSSDSVSFNNQNIIDTAPTAQDYRRHHEIYITDDGKTFSHERARMAVQAEDTGPASAPNFLATSNWHVENVSPKLRGYRDLATTYNKYVRLYILNYNVDTGEYDGYIGQRVSGTNGITKVGPRTIGRKNVPTRFYDETNIDFIEVCFDETSTSSPGISILSDATTPAPLGGDGSPRYVDIELFDSLINQDEVFFLATCEVNWDPSPAGSTQIVQRVVDRREFGSIGADDFTQEAIDFITSGDRFLHDNGVLKGLEFDFINPTDNREIFYKGGFALVNGKVVPVNPSSVTIPEVHENGSSPPTTEDWAVCVNESGTLIPILLTASKQQFFAKDNNSSNVYYVPSVTFAELVEKRKDLTPIAVVTASIASITITDSDVLDVRRFVDDGKKRDLVYSPSDFAGTFHTADALKNWVNQYSSSYPFVVKVRGEFDVDTSIDLTGLTNKVILDGDGAVFNVTANKGFLVDANITFKNIIFNYNPSSPPTYVTNDKINSANGCIYQGTGTNINDVTIERCVFTSSVTTQRPPFISIERSKEDVVDGLYILDNKFNDDNSDPAEDQAAIAIISKNDGAGTASALVINSKIDGNICNNHQGIYITHEVDAVAEAMLPGISTVNTRITNNFCGVIGFITSSVESTYALDTRADRTQSLTVSGNTCNIIGNVLNVQTTGPGTWLLSVSDLSSGSVHIHNNTCHWIWLVTAFRESQSEFSQTMITNNRLTAYDQTYLDQYVNGGSTNTIAIAITGNSTVDEADEVIITDNSIRPGRYDSTSYLYDIGINLSTSANVRGNLIYKCLETSGTGINATESAFGPSGLKYTITHNKIYRGTTSISRYIELSTVSGGGGLCADNYLDLSTVDGSDTETITSATTRSVDWVVERNKNQVESIRLPWSVGQSGLGATNSLVSESGTSQNRIRGSAFLTIPTLTSEDLRFYQDSSEGSSTFFWQVFLNNVLPKNTELVDFTYTLFLTTTPTAGSAYLTGWNLPL